MADLKISQLPVASTPLAGTELVPIVQGGTTDQTTVEAILKGTVPSGTANGVLYLNGSKVVTSGNFLTFDGSSVGIGTSSPSSRLEVVGGNIRWGNASTSIGQLAYDGGQVYIGSNTFTPVVFTLGGGETMRLNSTGLGIGTSNPQAKLVVSNAGAQGIEFGYSAGLGSNFLQSINRVGGADVNMAYFLAAGGSHQFYNNGTLSATLNSSGNLGLGVTPSAWFSGYRAIEIGTALGAYNFATNSGLAFNAADDTLWKYRTSNFAGRYLYQTNSGYYSWLNATSGTAGNAITWIEQMRLDASGNLGLGVTPSAWSVPTLQLPTQFAVGQLGVSKNAYYDGAWKYITTGLASVYQQGVGIHAWYTAASGIAGNAITFTQAMTLDASGNLVIGTTSASSRLHVTQNAGSIYQIRTTNNSTATDARSAVLFVNDTGDAGYVGAHGSNTSVGIGFPNATVLQSTLSAGVAVIASNASGPIVFHTGSTSAANRRMAIPAAGGVVIGNGSTALATNATDGFLYVPTCAGTPTGTPTAQTGTAPIVVDTTNNKLYFYSGGQWRDAGP